MSATVQTRSWHGAGAGDGGTDKTGLTIRFKAADNDTQDASNQITRPGGASITYSYIKQLRLQATVAPITSIGNIKFYVTGAKQTGVDVIGRTQTAYTDPTVQLQTQLPSAVSVYAYTSAAPLSVVGSIGAATGAFGDYVQLQMAVGSTAAAGVQVLGTFVTRFDEQ